MSSGGFLKDVPEFIETNIDEALDARSQGIVGFKELGPPDLIHLTKSTGKTGQKDVGDLPIHAPV